MPKTVPKKETLKQMFMNTWFDTDYPISEEIKNKVFKYFKNFVREWLQQKRVIASEYSLGFRAGMERMIDTLLEELE